MTKRTCTIENCANKPHSNDNGLCEKHYRKVLNDRYGRSCSIPGCSNEYYRRDYCRNHYRRWSKYGDPHAGQQRFSDPRDTLAALSEWQGDCLIWTGSKDRNGYGYIAIAGKTKRVHRYVWEQAYGAIPKTQELDHRCWSRSCINVDHIRLVTRTENNRYLAGASANSSSGVRNVYRNGSRWQVAVNKDGQARYFGTYDTIAEAAQVADQARKDLFGEFAGRG